MNVMRLILINSLSPCVNIQATFWGLLTRNSYLQYVAVYSSLI